MARDTDDDAPWLAEGVPEARSSTLVPRGRLFGGIALFVLLAALVGVGLYVVISGSKSNGSNVGVTRAEDAPLITADPGPYKVPPENPGGLAVEGSDQTIYSAGSGVDPNGVIDPTRAPEEPLARPGAAAAPAANAPRDLLPPAATAPVPEVPAAKPVAVAPKPVEMKPVVAKPPPAAAKPEPVKAEGGAALQLGAFSSAAKADAAWARVTAKHAELAALSHRVEPLARDGATLYRLRAAVGDRAAATRLCGALAATGDACIVAK